MNKIDTRIAENSNALEELYFPSTREIKTDIYALNRHQQARQRADKEMTSSLEICSSRHKVAQELLNLCRLAQLEELRKNIIMEELVDNVHDNTSHR